MSVDTLIPGEYDRRARLGPTLLVVLPAAFAFACWFPSFSWPQLAGGLLMSVFLGLLAQIGRDRGKRLEAKLFEEWGGRPSVQLLRHSADHLPGDTRARYHQKLQQLIPETRLPNRLAEATDPVAADAAYESCSDWLRERTRDTQAFRLLFEENMNYGMRRNLWAMKPAGIFLCVIGLVTAALATIVKTEAGQVPPIPAIVTVINGVMLALWVMRFTKQWVREAAFSYAERLLAACESLHAAAK